MGFYLASFVDVISLIGCIILAILILMVMIVIHELGHYTAGKLLKFKINEFSIGFGKAIFKKTKKNGEIFAIRCVPLGGYCAFEGEDEDGESPDAFNKQAWWKRLIVLFSGAFFNFLSAILMCVVLLAVIGNGSIKVVNITGDNANLLQVNDVITHVDGEKSTFFNGGYIKQTADVKDDKQVIVLTVERVVDGEKQKIEVPITKCIVTETTDPTSGEVTVTYSAGITPQYNNMSFGRALLNAIPFTFEFAWQCLVAVFQLITFQAGLEGLGGPITTIGHMATATKETGLNLILLCPLLATNLAVFNLLPIPALDGARMIFVGIEGIRKKPINRDLEAKIHGIGLIVLFSLVIIVDILQLFVFH